MDLWTMHEFRVGLGAGVAALVVLLVCSVIFADRYRYPLPLGGLAFAVAGLWSVGQPRDPRRSDCGHRGPGRRRRAGPTLNVPAWACYVLAVPCGWAIGFHAGVAHILWVQALVAVVAYHGRDARRRRRPRVAAGGTHARPVRAHDGRRVPGGARHRGGGGTPRRGCAAGLAGLAFVIATMGRSGAAAATAVFVWGAAVGGRGRPASIVGSGGLSRSVGRLAARTGPAASCRRTARSSTEWWSWG